jgi:uncharacterized membrane protein YqjE
MADPIVTTEPAPSQQPITQLVSGILDDAQRLAKQQFDMLKAEIREDMSRTQTALMYGGLGIVGLTVGTLCLVFGLIWMLHEQTQLSMWGSAFVIGGLFIAAGVVLGYVGKNMFESFNPLPDKTFNALQENLSWKTSPQT